MRSGDIFLPIGHAIAIGIQLGVAWIVRVEPVQALPCIGHSITVGICQHSEDCRLAKPRRRAENVRDPDGIAARIGQVHIVEADEADASDGA